MPNRGTVRVGAGADGVVRAHLAGEFDTTNAAHLRAVLVRAVDQAGEPGLEVDLSAVRFVDSMGLGALVAAFHRARGRGVPFRVGQASPVAARLLNMTGLARLWCSRDDDNHPIYA